MSSTERDSVAARLDELKDELDEIDERRAEISGQIEKAKAEQKMTGEYSDADWFRRAKGALRHLGVERNQIAREIGEHNRRLRELNAALNRDAFCIAVRDVVTEQTWARIVERHEQMKATQ